MRTTPFHLRVWRALRRIPPDTAVSYCYLAKANGSPGISCTFGTAVGANTLTYLIPCQRVIRETGIIGQYRWGHERKCALLGREWCIDS